MKLQNLFALALVAGTLALGTIPAQAAPFIPDHPRVNQVNNRFADQHARIEQGIRNGSLSRGELARLHTEHAAMKGEEHAMRAVDHGHLTRADQRALNHQENQRSRQIFRFKHN